MRAGATTFARRSPSGAARDRVGGSVPGARERALDRREAGVPRPDREVHGDQVRRGRGRAMRQARGGDGVRTQIGLDAARDMRGERRRIGGGLSDLERKRRRPVQPSAELRVAAGSERLGGRTVRAPVLFAELGRARPQPRRLSHRSAGVLPGRGRGHGLHERRR